MITVSVVASQGGYFFMLKTIIVTNKAKQIMYSKQSPPLKGVETAAAVSLCTYYITSIWKTQDNFENILKNFGKPIDFGKPKYYNKITSRGGDNMKTIDRNYDYSELLGLIKAKKLRQEDLAREIHMNPATLNLKLRNKSEFTQSQMKQICVVLGIPMKNLSKFFFCSSTLENASTAFPAAHQPIP